MIIELHILQSFAPSNLNRDDTGAPKDCDFGGVRRARISSQSLKRAMRRAFAQADLVPSGVRAVRTKKAPVELVASRLMANHGRDEAEARKAACQFFDGSGIKVKDDGKTDVLLFLGPDDVDQLARTIDARWEDVRGYKWDPKKSRQKSAGPFEDSFVDALVGAAKGIDLALFGRMIADLPDANVDAAAQVAHAISTHRVELDFDYFTAMDDLATEHETGAAMLDTVEFNAATYYRYATVDVTSLGERLGDGDRVRLALDAFLRAAIVAEPTGKQNSFAAHNPPSYVLLVARDAGTWSLANAFLRPVRATTERDLVDRSIEELEGYWARLGQMYGTRGLRFAGSAADRDLATSHEIERVRDVDALVARVVGLAAGGAA